MEGGKTGEAPGPGPGKEDCMSGQFLTERRRVWEGRAVGLEGGGDPGPRVWGREEGKRAGGKRGGASGQICYA